MSKTDKTALDEAVFLRWVDALVAVSPPPALRERVLARARGERDLLVRTITADQGWMDFFPGVRIKMLYRDEVSGAKSFLARLEPGVALPAHGHEFAEECYVIEGEIIQGDITIRKGDYHFAAIGAQHGTLRTNTGALIFMRAGFGQHIPEAAAESTG